jgi:SAM-dependent methyltransferase
MKNNKIELSRVASFSNNIHKIEFLFDATSSDRTIESLQNSQLASTRLRTGVAAEAAKNLNYQINLYDGQSNKHVDMIVVGKVNNVNDEKRPERWLQRIIKAKTSGSKIILDYTDHHLEQNTATGDFYRKSINHADAIICSSEHLKISISKFFSGPVFVIEEPIDVSIIPPKEKNNDVKTILWFGHASNLPYLLDCLVNMFSHDIHARLIIMTNAYPFPEEYSKILNVDALKNIDINVVPWSNKDLIKASNIADFCILPTGYKDAKKAGASSNRLITALALGMPVLSDQLLSYQKFSGYFEILSLENLLKFTNDATYNFQKIINFQEVVALDYSRSNFMHSWSIFFNDILANMNPKSLANDVIKLNLGCGDKILDGYINVDVVESRAGKKPDVICDLHDLSKFKSNSVDEILAVHVVEHFWQWEVVDILKEWTRVLKPGGKMILECPNLVSAAEEFLKNSDIAAMGGPEGQRSMWVFYGDPGWRDPLMIHRWGYTPRSLATVMASAGLTELKQEPAQFKLREPRDMRITGIK